MAKKEEIKFYINKNQFDIIIVTESHVTADIADNELYIKGFNTTRSNTENKKTAGIVIYSKVNIQTTIIKEESMKEINSNILTIELSNEQNEKINLITVYRSPTYHYQQLLERLEQHIKMIKNESENLFIIGDLNIDLMKNTNEASNLISIMKEYNLKQRVLQHTRQGCHKKSLLDIVFVAEDNLYDTTVTNDYKIAISDHTPQIIKIKEYIINLHIKKTVAKRIDHTRMLYEVNNLTITSFMNKTVDEKWILFYELLTKIEENCTTSSSKLYSETQKITINKTLSKLLSTLYELEQLPNSALVYSRIKNIKKKIKSQIDSTIKQMIINNTRNFKDAKKTWNVIKDLNNIKIKSEMKYIIIGNDKELVNEYTPMKINQTLINNVNNIIKTINESDVDQNEKKIESYNDQTIELYNFKTIDYDQLNKLKSQIKFTKGSSDTITKYLIKLICYENNDIMIHLINSIIVTAEYPKMLKQSKIIPIMGKT